MPRKLLKNISDERDANKAAERYIGSSDVLGDMQRDYGSALSGVRIHDDAAAAQRLDSVGRDGLASGRDVFMRPGLIGSGWADANGLFAHALAHVAQQDSGSVAYGSEQGGLLDWFRSFGKKKRPYVPVPDDDTKSGVPGIKPVSGSGRSASSSMSSIASESGTAASSGFSLFGWLKGLFGKNNDTPSSGGKGSSRSSSASASAELAGAEPSVSEINRKTEQISGGKLPKLNESGSRVTDADIGSVVSAGGGGGGADSEENEELNTAFLGPTILDDSTDYGSYDSRSSITLESVEYDENWNEIIKDGGRNSGSTAQSALPPAVTYGFRDQAAIDPSKAGKINRDRDIIDFKAATDNKRYVRKEAEGLFDMATQKYGNIDHTLQDATYRGEDLKAQRIKQQGDKYVKPTKGLEIRGLNLARLVGALTGSLGEDMDNEQILELVGKLNSGMDVALDDEGDYSDDLVAAKNTTFDEGMLELKGVYYNQLKKLEATYGKMPTQMHPDDFLRQISDWNIFNSNFLLVQDVQQMMTSAPKYFDFENDPKDKEMKDLQDYYFTVLPYMKQYIELGLFTTDYGAGGKTVRKPNKEALEQVEMVRQMTEMYEGNVKFGPQFDKEQLLKYKADLKKRAGKDKKQDLLFGAFK